MFTVIVILIIFCCILLSVVVLAQSSKGDGLAGGLGGPGSIGTAFGVRRTSDFLSRATLWLAGIFMVLTLLANLFFLPTAGSERSVIQSGAGPQSLPPSTSAPAVPQGSTPIPPAQKPPSP